MKTPKEFQQPLLEALWDLSGGSEAPVDAESVYGPVLQKTGHQTVDDLGIEANSGQPLIVRLIQWACKNLRAAQLVRLDGRGKWALTAQGIAMMQPQQAQQEEKWDPYILQLLCAQTTCFGYFSKKASPCAGCIIQELCVAEQGRLLQKLDVELKHGQLLQDLVSLEADTSTAKPTTRGKTRQGVAKPVPSPERIITQADNVVCDICQVKVPKGSQMDYTWKEGAFKFYHPHCWENQK